MQGAAGSRLAEQGRHALDLPPSAIMDDIAEMAAGLGTGRGFLHGMGAKSLDKRRRLAGSLAIGQVNMIVQGEISRRRTPFS